MPKRLEQEEFIKRCKQIFGNDYSFEKSIYKNIRSPITLTCKYHGDFEQTPHQLLYSKSGCRACNKKWKQYLKRRRLTTSEFITKATKKHNGVYDYNKVVYFNTRSKVTITCPIHGDFVQAAGSHLEGYGCPKCADLKHGEYRPWYIKTYFDRFPEKKNDLATLYILYCAEEDFFKIGVTIKQSVDERLKYMHQYHFEIVDQLSSTLYNVCLAEQDILSDFKDKKYNPQKRFGGYSECITERVDIRKYIPNEDGILTKEGKADL